MKSCENCKYADWQRTAAGKLHPSGDGRCTAEIRMPVLPLAYRWSSSATPYAGGYIERRKELKHDCPRFAWKEPK